ncbi:hypothetical protein BDK51DRAFT_40466 [Blyttiomyces helicus]|uniref:F-box domain-containing protein n=1 Tax=Blyttiomyces helicus TaxID=388810 RepID=A0A4P9WB73_9FUNG|nr:hypothetical protein BDK51DRAFT_40466 [Blyttiomyces helicus]|eukprot:RKO89492.1 hypothetical protein BDK51DRAFT_40466 [Blyttiomyces helicus]
MLFNTIELDTSTSVGKLVLAATLWEHRLGKDYATSPPTRLLKIRSTVAILAIPSSIHPLFANVRTLEISHSIQETRIPMTNLGLLLAAFPRLTSFKLTNARILAGLEVLELRPHQFPAIVRAVSRMFAALGPRLRKLVVTGTDVSDMQPGACPNLETLEIIDDAIYPSIVYSGVMQQLFRSKNAQIAPAIRVFTFRKVLTSSMGLFMRPHSILPVLSNVEELNVYGENLGGSTLAFPNPTGLLGVLLLRDRPLTVLRVVRSECRATTFLSLLKHRGSRLRVLYLRDSAWPTPEVVDCLARHAPELEEFWFAGCSGLDSSWALLDTLKAGCPELEWFAPLPWTPGVLLQGVRGEHD